MKRYLVKPGSQVDLSLWDPNDEGDFKGHKKQALAAVTKLDRKLGALQEILYADHKRKVLIVLQGMDTAGKDGTISHVFASVNPQGVRVVGFKVPTPEELDHDYLWRVHKQVPLAGEMVIFNPGDLKERKLWPEYMQAYEQALAHTSTDFAPWYVVPANRKWYRDLVISATLVEALEKLKLKYSKPAESLEGVVVE